jgi:1-acyl-sn-glycerol-3-phosphate acyltransferase
MGLKNIEEKSIGYNLVKGWTKFWHNKVYYRSFTILGTENIPKDKPLIFTPNHQNALMDALALLFSINKQFVFIARADIFKNPIIAKILYFLKLLPIYRVRDGYDNVKKSRDIIHKTTDIIKSGSAIVILPEGNHSGFRRLRPLKKGFARMAFQAEESNDYKLDIHIVPVGIDYDHFFKTRGSLVINFGKPVPVHDYYDLYKDNKAVAINKIKDQLSTQMVPLIVNIKSEDNYNFYNDLRVIYRNHFQENIVNTNIDTSNRIQIDQYVVNALTHCEKKDSSGFINLKELTEKYSSLKIKYGFSNDLVRNNGIKQYRLLACMLSLIITLPVFVYGTVVNILPYVFPIIASNQMKDEQFRSTFRYALSLISFPIFYLIQSTIIFLISKDITVIVIFLISLPLSAMVSWRWRSIFFRFVQGCNYFIKKIFCISQITEIESYYQEIILQTDKIIEEYNTEA